MSSTRKKKLEQEEHLKFEEKRSPEAKARAMECIVSLFAVCRFLATIFHYYENSYKEGVQLDREKLEHFINEKSRIRLVTGESNTVQNFVNAMCDPKIPTKITSNFKSLLGKKLMKFGSYLVQSDIDEIRDAALKITRTVKEDQKRSEKLVTKYDSFLVISDYFDHRINEKLSTPVQLEHSLLLKEWMGHGTILEQSKEQTEIEVKNFFEKYGKGGASEKSKLGKKQVSKQQGEGEESDGYASTDGPVRSCLHVRPTISFFGMTRVYEIVEDDIPAEDIKVARTNEKQDGRVFSKRDFDGAMPGVLRFGKRGGVWEKRESSVQKKEMPGVLRFGKRAYFDEKKSVPGVLRFGKRSYFDEKKSVPGVLRFGKRDVPMDKREIPGVLRFGKRDYMTELFDKRSEVPGVLRFGKRDVPGVLRFGKRSDLEEHYAGVLLKKSVPGVLRFGRK
ncbi:unnamed protein product [Caenorhabditis brenneri]